MSDSTPTPADSNTESAPLAPQPIVARAGSYYRNMRYLMTVVTLGMGAWFLYDGFIGYPGVNQKIVTTTEQRDAALAAGNSDEAAKLSKELTDLGKTHSDTDLLVQRVLGFSLIPGAFVFLGFILHRSRGEYRLENNTLHAPGHPPIPLDHVLSIDNRLWERKGIATLEYKHNDGTPRQLKLDDFIYDRTPIDQIHAHVVASLKQ